ncbi:MAG: hypothetical protein P9X24_02900 [Candidatus Hatepunaea meridiana]|nr:hypothetical protein [Candidatus Hatepunaea meridiana]
MNRVYLKEDVGVYFGGLLDKEEFAEILLQRIDLLIELKGKLDNHRKEIRQHAPDIANLACWLVTHHIMHVDVEIEWFQKIHDELLSGRLVYGFE